MFFKEDWDEARQRLTAWWEDDTLDRPIIQAFAPRNNPKYASEKDVEFNYDDGGFARNLGNPHAIIRGFRRQCAETYLANAQVA